MRSRSLGISFVAAVIVPSILLAVLSIRAAGREEAWMERQMAATLDAEVTHAASLANAEVSRVVDDLRGSLDVPPGAGYGRALSRWKDSNPLVAVPFLLSARFAILWPTEGAGEAQKQFLKDNGEFLSDRAATTVLQNIAVRYQAEILAKKDQGNGPAPSGAGAAAPPPVNALAHAAGEDSSAPERLSKSAAAADSVAALDEEQAAPAATSAPPAATPAPLTETSAPLTATSAPAAEARQMAIDTFAQSAEVQSKVYTEARQKGDQLNARAVQPRAFSAEGEVRRGSSDRTPAPEPAAPAASLPAASSPAASSRPAPSQAAPSQMAPSQMAPSKTAPSKTAPSKTALSQAAPSQYVLTKQLLHQIAAGGEYGVIPRFVADRLEFLFWERQKDGRIAGCRIQDQAFRSRIAGVLESTWTPVRILTLLDENGTPLLVPPDSGGRDWHRPFVSREIGESLPRWEAAAYLTKPDAIAAQARTSSLVIWILVMILFVSVAGGGIMVLSSVYSEMRLAQQKATFVTNVSHELKTPLTSISLFVDLLRRKGPLAPAKRQQYLSLMASETERLTRLINNVLDFSREKGTRRYAMRTVDAAEVASQIVESQRVRLESRGFTLRFQTGQEPAPGRFSVTADPEAVKQVLLNLLSNAEKYSRGTREILVSVERDTANVSITVADRGIGVPDHQREKIFQEFYRVDESLSSGVQGTGLGLSIARRIARDHGGDVTCAPRPGGGTEFTVRLPVEAGR